MKLGQGQQKTGEGDKCSKNTCLEDSTGTQVNWEQVSVMIRYKNSFPQMLSCSQAKMGRGTPLCEELREKIVQMFQNNVSQRAIAKNLSIAPSTVHNIIKRYRESPHVSGKDESQSWMPGTFDHSGSTASKTDISV